MAPVLLIGAAAMTNTNGSFGLSVLLCALTPLVWAQNTPTSPRAAGVVAFNAETLRCETSDGEEFDVSTLPQSIEFHDCVNLGRVNFHGHEANRITARGSNLSNITMSNAFVTNSDFSGASFVAAFVNRSDLSGGNFTGANFSRARLWNSNFSQANLQKADLSGADLRYANLEGADLREVRYDTTTSFLRATYNSETKLPFSEEQARLLFMVLRGSR